MPEEPKHEMLVDVGGRRQRREPVDYPSNSRSSKKQPPEKKRPEKIEGIEITQRKAGLGSKVARNFLSDDAGTVVSYVFLEVLIPAARNMIVDAGQQALERIFYGESRPRRGSGERSGYFNYQRASEGRREPSRAMSAQEQATHDFSRLILPSRGAAMEVIERLQDIIFQYEVGATVSDLYDLVGVTGAFTDNKWGWTNLSSATVKPVRDGYILVLPDPRPLT